MLAAIDHSAGLGGDTTRERAGSMVYLNVDPAVDPIRDDPRFAELLEKAKRPEMIAG